MDAFCRLFISIFNTQIPLLAQLYMISLLGYNTFKTVQLLFVKGHVHHFKCSETVLTVIAMDLFIESLV
ncbi:hypothetical protein T12_7612 [Trichinella patagoniensis]|uniref:Uncharacterized protein n=1 Tax=Trichinella patagoniensis TaxID=990121 RepID=A0A0V1AH58_9BILA|nr:hypothetical protein T12_7612 [Trichinella patagoniensis]